MADPRFYDNRGPFRLAELCRIAQLDGEHTGESALVYDVAPLDCAGPPHIAFCDRRSRTTEIVTAAGWCIMPRDAHAGAATQFVTSANVLRAFAAIAAAFYPEHENGFP